jgi:hypothetical protein
MILDTRDVRHPPPCVSQCFMAGVILRSIGWMGADCVVKHIYTSEQAKVVEDKPGH